MEKSKHVTLAPAEINCIAFPPGAEKRSKTSAPDILPSTLIGMADEAPWIHHLPSLKPGNEERPLGFFNLRIHPVLLLN